MVGLDYYIYPDCLVAGWARLLYIARLPGGGLSYTTIYSQIAWWLVGLDYLVYIAKLSGG
jgi:hypothetical protein